MRSGTGRKVKNLLIPRQQFWKLVKEILKTDLKKTGFRIQSLALTALQEATEAALVYVFESKFFIRFSTNIYTNFAVANLFAIDAKRVTIHKADMVQARNFGEIEHGYAWFGHSE